MSLAEFAIKHPVAVHISVWLFTLTVMFISLMGVAA